jgi:hypothetical protein
MHFCSKELSSSDLMKAVKKLIGEPCEKIATVGLAPFYADNLAPAVSNLGLFLNLYHYFYIF